MSFFKPVIVGCAGRALDDGERELFAAARPAGLILFARNIGDPDQVRALVADFRATVEDPAALVAIDQEGGRVARLGPPHWPVMPPAARFGALAASDFVDGAAAVELASALVSAELRDLGISMNCVPLLDVPVAGAHDIIGDRAWSEDPQLVARLGRVALDSILEAGILPVVKHIPGHGRAGIDSHQGLPHVACDLETLCETDLVPFKALADAPFAMTAHIVYDALDTVLPATLSAKIIAEVIRGEIGFAGLLLSDDLAMGALAGPHGARAQAARAAGCDIVLHCSGKLAETREVLDALEAIEPGSPLDERLAAARARAHAGVEIDRDHAGARLADLLAGTPDAHG